ncbi:AAA family ATPase [Auraticoccus monumenti]|uniref:AAA domain-containing protein n=1 Tax=Auraticoccus monumenti TaxID=675864 RepID=A0A1G7AHK0_9ACTN|nr:AAA family ATPase [Auraticoccus monumenti]SDE14200.1 AAA domain-containing protein [Auraticoccus monumenti]
MPTGPDPVGSSTTVLIVLRGNSAAGKSTVAAALRSRLGRGVALVEQDYLRRTVLREHDRPDLPNIGLIDMTIRYALNAGYHVIADGIFGSQHYGSMLRRLSGDHRGPTFHYYFDIPLVETQTRHLTKAHTVPAGKLAEWYHSNDLLELPEEQVILPSESAADIVDRIVRDVGLHNPPIRTELEPEAHLA